MTQTDVVPQVVLRSGGRPTTTQVSGGCHHTKPEKVVAHRLENRLFASRTRHNRLLWHNQDRKCQYAQLSPYWPATDKTANRTRHRSSSPSNAEEWKSNIASNSGPRSCLGRRLLLDESVCCATRFRENQADFPEVQIPSALLTPC